MIPKVGETWFVEFGMDAKPRWAFVVAVKTDARLAIASVVTITTQHGDTPYEVALPRVPWLKEASFVNAQSLQPVRFSELTKKAPGQFDVRILNEVKAALKLWLAI